MERSATGKWIVGPSFTCAFILATDGTAAPTTTGVSNSGATWLARRAESGLDVYAYFDNDQGGHAPRDAARLRRRIAQQLAA